MSKNYPLILSKHLNTPLLATTHLVQSALSLLIGSSTPTALSNEEGEQVQMVELRGDVAILNITGPIFRYGKVEACDVVYGTKHYSQAFSNLENDPVIKHIVINFDTGGGEATGIGEFAQQIKDAQTPTIAYVDGLSASAGYWLASACDKIVAHETSFVGSIGVVFMFLDDAKLKKKIGVEEVKIVSTLSPDKVTDYKTDTGRGKIQTLADDLAEIFIFNVSNYRNVSKDNVISKFGKGDIMIASKALEVGMIDSIGNFENLITQLGGKSMKKEKPNMSAEAFKSDYPTAYQEILVLGATQERERIESILTMPHSQANAKTVMKEAFNPTSTVDKVMVTLYKENQNFVSQQKESFYAGGDETAESLSHISTVQDPNIDIPSSENKILTALDKAIQKKVSK